jgi:hypothetical protein
MPVVPDHVMTMLENIRYDMDIKFKKEQHTLSEFEDDLVETRCKIHDVISPKQYDDQLLYYSMEAWKAYDTLTELYNLSKYTLLADYRHYSEYSYISSKIMTCPLTHDNGIYTDENYAMFKYSLQRWKDIVISEPTEEELPMFNLIHRYFENIEYFVKVYERIDKDAYDKTIELGKLYSHYLEKAQYFKKNATTFMEAIDNIDGVLMEIYLKHTIVRCASCGTTITITNGEECCDEMDLTFEY